MYYSPQCHPSAIAHLCKSCDVSILLHDESFQDLAIKTVSQAKSRLCAVELPWQAQNISVISIVRDSKVSQAVKSHGKGNTSGTSTGLPKPIIQSHRAAFEVLPVLDGRQSATFTTTPLYHGGIADCLRAWTSKALIWLFPAATVPITAHNIQLCLSVAAKATLEVSAAQVKYFSSVPYVLEMLSRDES